MPESRGKRSIFSVRPYLRRIGARNSGSLAKRWHSKIPEYSSGSARETASWLKFPRFGKLFIASFADRQSVGRSKRILMSIISSPYESPLSLSLLFGGKLDRFDARLGFDSEAVYIEALQGPKDSSDKANWIRQELGMPWPDFLLRQIEEHARGLGFRYVRIHDPSTSLYFNMLTETVPLSNAEFKKIKRRVDSLVKWGERQGPLELSDEEITALKMVKQKEGVRLVGRKIFLERTLNPSEREAFWARFERAVEIQQSTVKLQQRIKSFINRVAKNNGYTKKGDIFQKSLSL
ncbi:MAG: hypothetical protein HY392_03970 [Candidatus Diapherotrites archaeon]|nr:hypothetical protein [Candidatus Diapherotrites archaeon]